MVQYFNIFQGCDRSCRWRESANRAWRGGKDKNLYNIRAGDRLVLIMSRLTVSLELPRDLLGALDIPESQLASRLLELVALELFRQGRISAGKGAEMLGISKWQFVQLLARYEIPYFVESGDELRAEVAMAEAVDEQNP
jgi:predicted HTH domain antitoxin